MKAETFRLLFATAGRELHVREIERQSGLADATVRQELKRLARLGVVESRRDGNRTYYRANAQHSLFPEIHNLVIKTSGLVDVLREALTDRGIRSAFVFGSLASGNENARSDVDLMVIGTISLRQIGKLLSGVSDQIGREINPHALTAEEFVRRKKARDHFSTTVMRAQKLFVIGNEHGLEAVGR